MRALFEAFRQGAESQDGTESATLRKSMRAAFEKNNLTFPKDISEQGYQNFAQVFNHVLKIATENDMDIAMVDAVWKWVGSDVYDVVHPNSDHQYSSSSEIATICKKVEQVAMTMGSPMAKVNRGLTPSDIIAVYREIKASGFQVPCPQCYVFSHWFVMGKTLETMAYGATQYT